MHRVQCTVKHPWGGVYTVREAAYVRIDDKKRMGGAGLGVGGARGAQALAIALSKPWLKEAPAQAAQALTSGAGRMEY